MGARVCESVAAVIVTAPAAQRLTWPLHGRDAELAFGLERLSDQAAGGIVVAGEPGVGKTRLASEIASAAGARGCAVRRVRATRSAASIPLGAFAALLPPLQGAPAEPAELLARARHAVVAAAGGARMVLCVDDAHLLDDASAALVHQLAAAGDAFVVLTVRAGEPAPDAVQSLWKDELCDLVQLGALPRDAAQRLLEQALGAALDGRSFEALWDRTRGNALFLRELVLYGAEQEALVQDGGIWRWRGDVAVGLRLGALVASRLEGLAPAELRVLELVAVGAPLEAGILDAGETAALETLERRGLVEHAAEGRRRHLDLAHPLHGEVIRAGLSRTRLERIRARLADAVEACGARRRADVLRVATWRLESGDAGSESLFARAAEQALAAFDMGLAERFARAAVQAGGGFHARLALARALAGSGRVAEAEPLLAELEREAGGDIERWGVALARATTLFFGLDRAADAEAALHRAERAIGDGGLRDELVVLRAWLQCTLGHPRAALDAAEPLLSCATAREQTRLRAALTVATALTMCGRSEDAVAVIDTWLPAARRLRDELPLMEVKLLGTRPLALQVAGRLEEATKAAQRAYDIDVVTGSAEGTAFAAFAVGSAWLARGRVATALRCYRESAALVRETDVIGFRPWALTGIAQAAAQAGDGAAAREALDELDAAPGRGTRNFEAALELTRAWAAAAGGELSLARRRALAAAEHAEALGQEGFAVRALHDLTRLGGAASAAAGLGRLAGRVQGPFARTAAAHADALLRRDGGALLAVAEAFAASDALLLAAEAADAAAAIHRDNGRDASARSAARRAAVLLDGCEGAQPPTLLRERAGVEAEELTSREREVALLAASGLSSREIAGRLVVSIRTVDNHLQRTYRKLGISQREELKGLIRAPGG